MSTKKSFLDNINTEELLDNSVSPFSSKSKKSKPVQIREYQYNILKRIAFEEDKKIIEVVEEALQEFLKDK